MRLPPGSAVAVAVLAVAVAFAAFCLADLARSGQARQLFASMAAEGRTVLVSSHLMSEMALTADHLIIIARGRLLADMPTDRFVESSARRDVLVRSPRADELATLLSASGAAITPEGDGGLAVTGLAASAIGDLAAAQGIAVHELVPRRASLERPPPLTRW